MLEEYTRWSKTSPPAAKKQPPKASHDEDRIPESPLKTSPRQGAGARGGHAVAAADDDFVDTDVEDTPKKAPVTPTKTLTKKKGDTTPLTPEEEAEKRKKRAETFVNFKVREQRRQNALNPGSKDIPEGQKMCLQGLKIVFTGDMVGLSREDATDLVRKYGG